MRAVPARDTLEHLLTNWWPGDVNDIETEVLAVAKAQAKVARNDSDFSEWKERRSLPRTHQRQERWRCEAAFRDDL